MSLIFELGINSADAVTLYPNYDYEAPEIKIKDKHRTASGRLFSYKWGSFQRFRFSTEYVPASVAALVNSWWSSEAQLLFFITSESATEVHSVMLVGDDQPLAEFSKPYIDKYRGRIVLETY